MAHVYSNKPEMTNICLLKSNVYFYSPCCLNYDVILTFSEHIALVPLAKAEEDNNEDNIENRFHPAHKHLDQCYQFLVQRQQHKPQMKNPSKLKKNIIPHN